MDASQKSARRPLCELEVEMQHMLQFLDTSLITPPSGCDLSSQQKQMDPQLHRRGHQQQLTPEHLRDLAALQETEERSGCNDLGEVIELLGSLDANDIPSQVPLHQQQQHRHRGALKSGNVGTGQSQSAASGDCVSQKVQLPRSTLVSCNHSAVENISPAGLLNGPSMSPATINWLQTLVPSTSSESLTGLISPAALHSVGSGSASNLDEIGETVVGTGLNCQADDITGKKRDGLSRTPSCEIIDWKAYNESCAENKPNGPVKWRVIPQHGPHAADLAINGNLSTSMDSKLPLARSVSTNGADASELSAQQQMYLAARKMAEDKNKRKAIVSPEYVQYGDAVVAAASSVSQDPVSSLKITPGSKQYATKVAEPSGRRPYKKYLHHTIVSAEVDMLVQQQQPQNQNGITHLPAASYLGGKGDLVRCKCTGKCRNARCACVKVGLVCGHRCKCVSCANPFEPMAREGIDIQLVVRDICLMQHLSKIKDMQELLDSTVSYECCEGGGGVVQVKHTIENGFACPHCSTEFTYSWCNNRLCPDAKKPRRHCAKCRRCVDHRSQHCNMCNHCYFAGVANSFRCNCHSANNGSGSRTRTVLPNPVPRGPSITQIGKNELM